jgi:hypothetical protein
MNDELERIWKDAAMFWCKVLFRYWPGGTEKNTERSVRIAAL